VIHHVGLLDLVGALSLNLSDCLVRLDDLTVLESRIGYLRRLEMEMVVSLVALR